MISKNMLKYCDKPELIENYEKAIVDKTQIWHCHHRLEEFVSKQWLIDHNDYYNVSPNELIFLTNEEHSSLHHKGKVLSEEIKKKISGVKKGYHHSEETKKKISEADKGKHWRLENGKRIWY